jgi:hemolysin activation/secretion protein
MSALLCLTGTAVAQQPPNAGSILRQLEPATPSLPAPRAETRQDRHHAPPPPGPRIHVRAFRIEGNHLVGTGQIQKLLATYVDRDLSPADLRQATDAVARFYSRAGWLARVLVPPQRVTDGVLRVQVIEGRFGEVVFPADTDLEALHVKPQRIVGRVQSQLTPGAPLSVADLTRGVLLAGDLPGISVSADEIAGEDPGLTNVVLYVDNQDLVNGQFSVDNYGQASIGSERATGWLDFNSVFGFGEEFGVLGILTPELQFGRVNGVFPLNDDGLTLGLNVAGLNYAVVAPAYRFDKPQGASNSAGSDLQYQLVRAADHNLSIGLTLLRKNFYNDDISGRVGDYHIYDALVFVNGNVYDRLLGDAVSTASFSAGRGWVDMSGSPGENADRFGADTQGQFNVFRYRVDRTQKLWGPFVGYLSLSGQLSYQNLDPSEQLYLGGPAGVRAYAVSSNGGSTGQIVTAEFRWNALQSPGCTCGLKVLYDVGHIRLNANAGFPLAPEPNSYFLQGAGIGAYGTGPGRLSFAVTVVRKVGGDASAEIPDSGLTGARQDTRVWGSLTWQF